MKKHTVTRGWINRYRTQKNAFTRAQIEALGLDWGNLQKGWISRLEGTQITIDQARAFEQGRTISASQLRSIKKRSAPVFDAIKAAKDLFDSVNDKELFVIRDMAIREISSRLRKQQSQYLKGVK